VRVDVLTVGTELLLGQIVDTNSSWIGEQLALSGIDSHFQMKVGDNLGRIVATIRLALDHERAARRFLDRLYRPASSVMVPAEDEVIACRCEEVSVGQIRRAARLGAQGPNQIKAFTRCGMGPCQGRICGPVVAAIIADVLGRPIAEIGTWRPRAPFKPITVGALADMPS